MSNKLLAFIAIPVCLIAGAVGFYYSTTLGLVLLVAVIGASYAATLLNSGNTTQSNRRYYLVPDLLFNPITWTLFQIVVTPIASYILAAVLWGAFIPLVQLGYLQSNPISSGIFYLLVVTFFILLNLPETGSDGKVKILEVPGPNYGALLTFWGMVIPIILTTGRYYWTGQRIGFGKLEVESETLTNKKGFINLGDLTFQVWNSAHAKTPAEKTLITIPAKNRADITGSLTLILERKKPRLFLDAQDAGLDIGERARQEYQELIELLNDTDVAAMQEVMSLWMKGHILITSFITENVGFHKAGAIIRDTSGMVMVKLVRKNASDEVIEAEKAAFKSRIILEADRQMRDAVSETEKGPDGTTTTRISVSVLQASSPITEVIEQHGYRLKRVTYGDITLSPEVSAAAKQASAEADERNAQISSARTGKSVRGILQPTPEELANPAFFELTTTLAAAADDKKGNVKVVHVSGGGKLATSLVAAAAATEGSTK